MKISATEILTITFIILKLTNVIDWSWWLVFAPIIIDWTLAAIIIAVGYIYLKKA